MFFFLILVFRKNISQLTLGSFYFIEISHIIIILMFSIYVIKNKLIINKSFYSIFLSISAFFSYGLIRFILEPGSLQTFIPFFYPLYIIMYVLLFYNIFHSKEIFSFKNFEKKTILILLLFLFTPIILFGSGIIGAGNTLIYSICFFSILLFVKNIYLQLIFSALFLISFFLSLERAILVNTFIPLLLYFVTIFKMEKKKFIKLGYLSFFILIIFFSYFDQIGEIVSNKLELRFDLSKENIIGFVKTIWSSDVEFNEGGAIGSRNHRIEMWFEVIENTSKTLSGTFFGDGFSTKIVENEFAGIPHNGFITIFKRAGLFGIFLFLLIIYKTYKLFIPVKSISLKKYVFLNLTVLAFLLEMMTGTVIDSPFTAIIIYMIFAYGISLGAMKNKLSKVV